MPAGKKNGAAGKTSAQSGGEKRPPGKSPRGRAKSAAVAVTPAAEAAVRARVDPTAANPGAAVIAVREIGPEVSEVGRELRALLAEVRAGREAVANELAGLREQLRGMAKEVAEADSLHRRARIAHQDSLAEALANVERVRNEVSLLVAGLGRPDSSPASAPAESANRLGVVVDPGVVVADVLPDGLAAAAGLARGDVIESVNGSAVHSAIGLRDAVASLADGTEITVRLRRAGDPLRLVARLGPAPADGNRLGVAVAACVVVADVVPGSPAQAAGLARGDVIEHVSGLEVHSGDQLRAAVLALPPGADVALSVVRAGEDLSLVARLDHAADQPPPLPTADAGSGRR